MDDKINISPGRTKVTQHREINYLGCLFDEKSSGESIEFKVIDKVNSRLSVAKA